jgi:putative ABC transport system permease protein
VTRYLARAMAAHVRAAPLLFALALLGVALGVASVLSIQILNRGAVAAFEGTMQAVGGGAEVAVLPRAGATLDEALLPVVLAEPGVTSAVPIVRAEPAISQSPAQPDTQPIQPGAAPPGARLDPRPALRLELVGVDLLSPRRGGVALPSGALADALGAPGWIAVTPTLARALGLAPGATLEVTLGTRPVKLLVGAEVDVARAAPGAPSRLALMDVAQAQALFGARGRLSEIAVRVAEGADAAEVAARLEARLAGAARVATTEARRSEASGLLAAFRLNLTALSLVSLLVGGFLVHAATNAALVRRREELGVLRALGATRAQVAAVVLADAALLGVLGTALGIPLGWAAARANLGAVSATLQNLYLLEAVERVEVPAPLVLAALAVGLAGALLGALAPALDAARADPRALLATFTLHDPARSRAPRLFAAALALLALAGGLVAAAGTAWRPGGFVAALAVLAAVALAAPLVLDRAARLVRPRRLGEAYGVRSLAGHLKTTALSAAALGVAASLSGGIATMVGSFRSTVDAWLAETLRADVYVTTASWRRGGLAPSMDPAVVAALVREPEVLRVDRLRQLPGRSAGRRVTVSGFDAETPGAERRFRFVAGNASAAIAGLRRGEAMVSEPLARKAGLAPGETLPLDVPGGEVRLRIAGVYADYGAEQGAVLLSLDTLARLFGDGPPTNVALRVREGTDVEAFAQRLRREHAADGLLVRANARLRAEAMAVFEQTFAVTRLLQGMSLLIAVVGVTLSLLVLARERAAEAALYHALGATRAQLFRVFLGRGLGIAAAGAALGLAGGAGLALALVKLVNPAWFGWSFPIEWPWRELARQAALLLAAAAAASLYPALRASAAPASELSRDAL